jgi:hypothetical protein
MVSSADLEEFFAAADRVLGPEKRTNVIYPTTRCNMDCSYCYEREARLTPGFRHIDSSREQIDEFIRDIEEREAGVKSSVVFMGGEPLLRPDLLEHTYERCASSGKPGGWSLNMVTNGTMFTEENVALLRRMFGDGRVHFKLEVSYDGSGQGRRRLASGGDSRPTVEAALDSLPVPFGVSYTVHVLNHGKVVRDLVSILERWGKRMVTLGVGFAREDLERAGVNGEELRRSLVPYAEALFLRYGVPLCDLACGPCGWCDKTEVGNAYSCPSEEKGIMYEEKFSQKKFDQF